MDFWQTLRVLLRRWYVAVPVLLATLGVAGATFLSVPTQYESSGTAVLIMPPAGPSVSNDPSKPVGTVNPLLAFDGSLEVSAKLETATLSDPAVLEQLAAQGGTAEIEAGDGGLNGPFILVIATSPSPATSQRTVQLAFAHIQSELTERQDRLGSPKSTYINVESVVSATPGEAKIGGKVRAAGAALALGLIVSLWSAFVIESIMQRRRGGSNIMGIPQAPLPPVLPMPEARVEDFAPAPTAPTAHFPMNHAHLGQAPVGAGAPRAPMGAAPVGAQPPPSRPPTRRRPAPRLVNTELPAPDGGGAPQGQHIGAAGGNNGRLAPGHNGDAGVPGPNGSESPN